MTQRTTVLVVGAGPCGLAMAAQLSRLGVEVTVVDAESRPHTGSRAILLWPPVREVLGELGLAERAARDAVRPAALHYHLGTGGSVRVPLSEVNAPLVLPQERTARLLAETLADRGVDVAWGTRVTDVVPGEHTVTVTATRADGGTTEIEADWVVGADGLRSQVRAQLGIDFSGARFPATFLLAEGRIAGKTGTGETGDGGNGTGESGTQGISTEEIHYFLADAGVALLAPLPGGEFRLSGAVPAGTEATAEHAQALLDERGPGGLRFTEVRTVTLFSSDERVAGALRSGRCFLVGDAAHVHSPIGGQGLNLGIPDTRNLAWKLAGVVHGRLHESILDSYDPERRAAIAQTLQATGRMARQAVAGPLARRIRDLTWRLLAGSGALARGYAPMLAGWRSHYPDVLFGAPADRTQRSRPRPGTRDPRWIPRPSDELAGRFQLLTYGGPTGQLAATAAELADRLPELVAHFPLDGPKQRFVLLRPDGYVAASGGADRFPGVAAQLAALAPAPSSPAATAR
ncbi:2-polyprenyl-6-methoxyphenol hydroxylase [Streptomyces sp. yr375]|uniref:FAD-dependent oxidoreductase n=1 Tax=Streptomyces sp. yr375 TaxID=1761906 RepID=UPI0008B0DFFE|nr:FAD-dependent monooxygenase [Streptomyces sp. yr375]SES22684.1 2-polyprenyl-6-methoxyphenol hydroxylase [Streptomyces sp. yr375]